VRTGVPVFHEAPAPSAALWQAGVLPVRALLPACIPAVHTLPPLVGRGAACPASYGLSLPGIVNANVDPFPTSLCTQI